MLLGYMFEEGLGPACMETSKKVWGLTEHHGHVHISRVQFLWGGASSNTIDAEIEIIVCLKPKSKVIESLEEIYPLHIALAIHTLKYSNSASDNT